MTPEELKAQEEAFAELKGVVEAGLAETSEGKEKMAKINKHMDTLEDGNQKLVLEMEEAKKETEALNKKYTTLELMLAKLPNGKAKEEVSAEMKAFDTFIHVGKAGISADEAKYLRTDIGPDGGFLVPSDMSMDILKNITEFSPMRSVSRVRTIGTKSMEFPKKTAGLQGGWTGEGGVIAESESTYGMEEIFAEKLMAYSIATMEQLQDSNFDMVSEISMDSSETFASLEGAAFVNGNGIKKAYGFLQDPDTTSVNSGVADNITGDSLIDITGAIKDGYNAVFLMNRRTIADIRQLKDGNGQYLWASGLAAGMPNTIAGERYVSMIDMPDIAANALAVAYGDFNKGYYIVDRVGMTMIRDEFTLATSGKVRFVFTRRVGGKTVVPEAIKILKCAV